ncbi:MAG: hypothetical protein LBH25_10085 [Fibromonadaceae bacterium]|nr:hypothetical protein [Fibromonadaceae bacterium]
MLCHSFHKSNLNSVRCVKDYTSSVAENSSAPKNDKTAIKSKVSAPIGIELDMNDFLR